jgi:small subunit ribosomal protein S6
VSNYECVVIFDGLLTEDDIKVLQDRVQEVITKNGGEVSRIDPWGKRHLAYEIKRCREGYYTVFYFSTNAGLKVIQELDRFCRIEEKVLRHTINHEIKVKPVEAKAPSVEAGVQGEADAEEISAPSPQSISPQPAMTELKPAKDEPTPVVVKVEAAPSGKPADAPSVSGGDASEAQTGP